MRWVALSILEELTKRMKNVRHQIVENNQGQEVIWSLAHCMQHSKEVGGMPR